MTSRVVRFDAEAVFGVGDTVGPKGASAAKRQGSVRTLLMQTLWTDEQLAEDLKGGNADALTVLFRRHSPLLFQIAKRIVKNDAEAEDAVQQVFLDVYQSVDLFDSKKGTFKSWLLMFAYQRSFNRRRAQIANRFFDTDPLEEGLPGMQPVAVRRSVAESSILAAQALSCLQPRQRRTIELIYYEGLTAEEVARRTGESVRVVRHNLYRGLEKLRQVLHAGTNQPRSKGTFDDA